MLLGTRRYSAAAPASPSVLILPTLPDSCVPGLGEPRGIEPGRRRVARARDARLPQGRRVGRSGCRCSWGRVDVGRRRNDCSPPPARNTSSTSSQSRLLSRSGSASVLQVVLRGPAADAMPPQPGTNREESRSAVRNAGASEKWADRLHSAPMLSSVITSMPARRRRRLSPDSRLLIRSFASGESTVSSMATIRPQCVRSNT